LGSSIRREYDLGVIERTAGRKSSNWALLRRCPIPQPSVMQLLWGGIAAYVFHHRSIDVRCASLRGTDPDALAAELS